MCTINLWRDPIHLLTPFIHYNNGVMSIHQNPSYKYSYCRLVITLLEPSLNLWSYHIFLLPFADYTLIYVTCSLIHPDVIAWLYIHPARGDHLTVCSSNQWRRCNLTIILIKKSSLQQEEGLLRSSEYRTFSNRIIIKKIMKYCNKVNLFMYHTFSIAIV